MVKETKDKCEREKIIVAQMIALYCKKQHRQSIAGGIYSNEWFKRHTR